MIINGDYMKNKETFKRNIYAFLIPILILVLSLGINKFYPFGNKLLTMLDGFNQYPGFLNSFIESLKNHQSFFSDVRLQDNSMRHLLYFVVTHTFFKQ